MKGLYKSLSSLSKSLSGIKGDEYNAQLMVLGAIDIDLSDITDNPIFTQSTEVLQLRLKQTKPPDYLKDEGIDHTYVFLEGRLITPKKYDFKQCDQNNLSLVFNDVQGRFTIAQLFNTPQAYEGDLEDSLGQKIMGWFQYYQDSNTPVVNINYTLTLSSNELIIN